MKKRSRRWLPALGMLLVLGAAILFMNGFGADSAEAAVPSPVPETAAKLRPAMLPASTQEPQPSATPEPEPEP